MVFFSFTASHVLPQFLLSRLHVNVPPTSSLMKFRNGLSFLPLFVRELGLFT